MTPQDIIDATNTFGRYGVPEENIFQEVMRARYLDYFLSAIRRMPSMAFPLKICMKI